MTSEKQQSLTMGMVLEYLLTLTYLNLKLIIDFSLAADTYSDPHALGQLPGAGRDWGPSPHEQVQWLSLTGVGLEQALHSTEAAKRLVLV